MPWTLGKTGGKKKGARTTDTFVAEKTSYTLTFRTTIGGGNATIADGMLVHDLLAPTVDAGPDMATVSDLDVPLDPTIVNNDPALTYAWTASSGTGVAITEDGSAADDTSTPGAVVKITQGTPSDAVVRMTLAVTRPCSNPVSDVMDIYRYDNSCKAKVAAGKTKDIYDSTDTNTDCFTNLADFAAVAAGCLVDNYEITVPVDK